MLSIFFAQIRRLSHISPGLKLISHKYLTDILVKNCKWLSRWELFPGRCWRHHFSRGINRTGQGSPVCSPGSTQFLLFSLADVLRRRQSSSHGGVPELVVEPACPWFLYTHLPAQHSEEGKPACGGDSVCVFPAQTVEVLHRASHGDTFDRRRQRSLPLRGACTSGWVFIFFFENHKDLPLT